MILTISSAAQYLDQAVVSGIAVQYLECGVSGIAVQYSDQAMGVIALEGLG
jgi:hypothetical protein